MRITVDTGACVGSGQCAMTAPQLFEQRDKDGTVVILDAEPSDEARPAARLAAMVCPVTAIHLQE